MRQKKSSSVKRSKKRIITRTSDEGDVVQWNHKESMEKKGERTIPVQYKTLSGGFKRIPRVTTIIDYRMADGTDASPVECGRVLEIYRQRNLDQMRELEQRLSSTKERRKTDPSIVIKPKFKRKHVENNGNDDDDYDDDDDDGDDDDVEKIPKVRSLEAERLARKRASMTEEERVIAKEAQKLYMREYRKNKGLSEKERQAASDRTAKYRYGLSPERKKDEREKAATAMQNFNAAKKLKSREDPEGCEKVTRVRRQHPATRKNAVRKEVYNKDTNKIDELVRYWNVEAQEHLFVSPYGSHYRCSDGCRPYHCEPYDRMEKVSKVRHMDFKVMDTKTGGSIVQFDSTVRVEID